MKKLIGIGCVLAASALYGAPEQNESAIPVEFVGYASSATGRMFVIHEKATNLSSPWLTASSGWRSYVISGFDPKSETLTVESEGHNFTLSLRVPKIVDDVFVRNLINGSFVIVDGAIVFSTDAQLKIGEGLVISASTGVMKSDKDQHRFVGNLHIQFMGRSTAATAVSLEERNGKPMMIAENWKNLDGRIGLTAQTMGFPVLQSGGRTEAN